MNMGQPVSRTFPNEGYGNLTPSSPVGRLLSLIYAGTASTASTASIDDMIKHKIFKYVRIIVLWVKPISKVSFFNARVPTP